MVMPPEPAVPLPRVIEVPPERVNAPECWKVMLLAACAPLMVMVVLLLPLLAEGPATKKRSSVFTVDVLKVPPLPVELVFQKLLVPQVPVGVPPAPAVPVPLESQ